MLFSLQIYPFFLFCGTRIYLIPVWLQDDLKRCILWFQFFNWNWGLFLAFNVISLTESSGSYENKKVFCVSRVKSSIDVLSPFVLWSGWALSLPSRVLQFVSPSISVNTRVTHLAVLALRACAYTVTSWWMHLLITMCFLPSFLLTLFTLKSLFSNIRMATPACFFFPSAYNILFHPLALGFWVF